MYEKTEQAILDGMTALKTLVKALGWDNEDKTASVTKLYDERTTIKDQRLHWRDPGGRLRVRAFRIDLPEMSWGLRRLWAIQQWLSDYTWEEAENELEEEWLLYMPGDFPNDAALIRRAIERFDELAPVLAQKVYDRATEEVSKVKVAAAPDDGDLPI